MKEIIPMKIVVGLGNPGAQYRKTRHNVGFLVLDALVAQVGDPNQLTNFTYSKKFVAEIYKDQNHLLIKPQTYMNASGQAVRAILDYYSGLAEPDYSNLYIVHDDLDIALGDYKIRFGHGPKAHNGLLSLYNHLGTDKLNHVRVGVDSRDGSRSITGSAYVLQPFMPDERKKVDLVIEKIVRELV